MLPAWRVYLALVAVLIDGVAMAMTSAVPVNAFLGHAQVPLQVHLTEAVALTQMGGHATIPDLVPVVACMGTVVMVLTFVLQRIGSSPLRSLQSLCHC